MRKQNGLREVKRCSVVTARCDSKDVECLTSGLWCSSLVRIEICMRSRKSFKYSERFIELSQTKTFMFDFRIFPIYLISNSPANPADV